LKGYGLNATQNPLEIEYASPVDGSFPLLPNEFAAVQVLPYRLVIIGVVPTPTATHNPTPLLSVPYVTLCR
jgi:hypothetical protein